MFPHIHWQNSKVAYHLHLTKLNGHSQFSYHQLHHKPSSPGVFPTSLTVPSCPLCWLFLLTFPRLSNFYLSSSSLWSKLQANIFSPQRAFSFQWTTVVWQTKQNKTNMPGLAFTLSLASCSYSQNVCFNSFTICLLFNQVQTTSF